MKNILVVFTGGTIGSQIEANVIETNENSRSKLLNLFSALDNSKTPVNFRILQPLQILSENLHPVNWTKIIKAIEEEGLEQFDGIIITHGTDTLAYTAAMLGLYFHHIKIPMLIVSSDLPLVEPKANGLTNFVCAVDFIRQFRMGGVFVSYKNPGETVKIHLATRISSCLQLSSIFLGIKNTAFMYYDNNCFFNIDIPNEKNNLPIKLKSDFNKRVLLIRPYPGLNYHQFCLDSVDVVLHDLYHSGTACITHTNGDAFSLLNFVQCCKERHLSIYLAPALKTENSYATTLSLLNKGAEIIWNMSLECAYAKLLLAYNNFNEESQIKHFLAQNLAGEHF